MIHRHSDATAGTLQMAATTINLNQAASTYDLLTGTTQAVILESLSFKMPAVDISGGSLTSISIQTDDATATTLISSAIGVLASLTSEAEITWTGCARINVGTKIQLVYRVWESYLYVRGFKCFNERHRYYISSGVLLGEV